MDSVARMHTDIVVLEEPEHINWFHIGTQWTHSFQHVVRPIDSLYSKL